MGTDAQLQQALQFIRAGKRQDARHELAKLIRNSPHHAQAWYLLSLLIEDRQKQIDCLQRTLALAPDHVQAKELLARLTQAARVPEQSALLAHNDGGANRGEALQPPLFPPTMLTEENDKPTERPSLAIKDEKEAYTPAKKAPEPPRPEHRVFTRRALSVGQLDDDKEVAANQPPDILQILVDDITRLPIITNPHQELCLGIQLQAAPRLDEILANWKPQALAVTFPFFVCQSLLRSWESLEQQCLAQALPLPRLEAWASELLTARRNVYALHRSRIRRFMRRVQAISAEDEATALLNSVYEVVETLAVFPGATLVELTHFVTAQQRLPAVDEMAAWLPAIDLNLFERQVKQRVKQTRETLTTGYLRYVLRFARGYVGQGIEYADLVQIGFIGLMRAVKKFDYREQTRFGAYTTKWLWQAIGREIALHSRLIRLPAHLYEQLRKWDTAYEQFDNGFLEPTHNLAILHQGGLLNEQQRAEIERAAKDNTSLPSELAQEYEKVIQKAQALHSLQVEFISWDEGVAALNGQPVDKGSVELLDVFPDSAHLPESVVDETIVSEIITEQLWSCLDVREEKILSLRYGLQDGQSRTLKEVGQMLKLSRERIRQIEAAALERLANRQVRGGFPGLNDLLIGDNSYVLLLNGLQLVRSQRYKENKAVDSDAIHQLDLLLSQLPRRQWHEGQPGVQGGQRREQLVAALEALAAPAHVSDIAEQMNDVSVGKDLEEAHLYNLLMRDEKTFILLGQGVFSLTQWEQARSKEASPVLTCCPQPLPDPPDFEDAFFESILVGQQALAQGVTAGQFTRQMLAWAKTDTTQQKWFLQSVLSAYYLVDLIPYVFYFGGQNPVLSCTLPQGDIQFLRYHCLAALTQRLMAMPEFWWLMQQHQPVRPVDLGELFADVHPHGLDDGLQRLRLLAGLGAAQKSKYGAYRLTPLGEACANQWKNEVMLETTLEPDSADEFSSLAVW